MQDLEHSVGFLIRDIARLQRRNFNRRAQDLGLSQAQWQALAYLSRLEGVNQVTLADRMEIQPITLVRLIDHLENAGLVCRQPDPNDRRAVRLYLTEKANPLLEQMWQLAAETREDSLRGMSDRQRDAIVKLLRQMKDNLLCCDDDSDAVKTTSRKVK